MCRAPMAALGRSSSGRSAPVLGHPSRISNRGSQRRRVFQLPEFRSDDEGCGNENEASSLVHSETSQHREQKATIREIVAFLIIIN
jgi:hypothetical protein